MTKFGKKEQLEWLAEYLKNLKMQRIDGEINYRGMEDMDAKNQLRGNKFEQLHGALAACKTTNENLDYKIHKTEELMKEIEDEVYII